VFAGGRKEVMDLCPVTMLAIICGFGEIMQEWGRGR